MNDNFWESLRQDFIQLREDCAINPPIKSEGRLTAIWTAQLESKKWRLAYNGKDGAGVVERFSWAAQSAVARLGFVGAEEDILPNWLDRLKGSAPKAYILVITRAVGDGKPDEIYSIEIRDLCGLSAYYCRKCQADEIRSRNSGAGSATPLGEPHERVSALDLPDLAPDAAERIRDALEDARSHVFGNTNETHLTQAMVLYLDSLAWEYILIKSSTEFEALINGIAQKARDEFHGDSAVAEDRKRSWIIEAQERAANGIVGKVIPIRVIPQHAQVFDELEHQFGAMPSEKGELQAILFDGTRFFIESSCSDATDGELHRMADSPRSGGSPGNTSPRTEWTGRDQSREADAGGTRAVSKLLQPPG